MTDPRVSVIIPVFNRPMMLREAVDSVLAQKFNDFELILVDDGSQEKTKKILRQYSESYPQKIKVFFCEHRGVSAARNAGIAKARGDFLAFLDSDDLWISSKLEKQLQFMDQKGAAVCQTQERWVRNGKNVNPMKKHTKRSGKIFFDCLPLCIVSPSAVMIKKDVFDKVGLFDEKLLACEDYDLWLRISLLYPIYTMPEKLITKKGGHSDQLSSKYWGMDRFRIYSMVNLLKSGASLDDRKKAGLFYYISEKAKVIAIGAKKRWKLFSWFKYWMISDYYKKEWELL
ncbi:MAG: glycosyltransferase family A protein [Candidatus Margulisbacteria bacterium]|nr:glycosyltransferase family A protein [Candidatus Margulisiibacteriota bacterium]